MDFHSEVLTMEERLSGEEFDDYYFQLEIEIIRSILVANESFKSLLANRLRYLTRLGAKASEADLNIPLDHAWKFSQLLADFNGGQEELDARYKVLQERSPSIGIRRAKSDESPRAATETSTIEDEGFDNSRALIEHEAALIVAQEEEAARENYLSERGSALALIKTTEGEETQKAISMLTDIEFEYARTYSKFERGIRLQQLIKQLSIEEQKRQNQRQKARSRNARKSLRTEEKQARVNKKPPVKIGAVTPARSRASKQVPATLTVPIDILGRIRRELTPKPPLFSEREVAQHPFKTNDTKDDRQFQTHGVRNPRAKRLY